MTQKRSRYATSRGLHRLTPAERSAAIQARKGNGLSTNNERNTLFTEAEVQYLLTDPRAGLAGLRTGTGTYNNLLSVQSALKKGQAIEDARVIVRGFAGIYAAADAAVKAILARATSTGRWAPTALYGRELTALDDLLFAYEQALRICTYQEFFDRQAVALARTLSDGERVFKVGETVEYTPPTHHKGASTS